VSAVHLLLVLAGQQLMVTLTTLVEREVRMAAVL
jgi:hypothetical protein